MGIRELKSRLSEFLRRAAHGERITVTDRGRPVALLVPPEQEQGPEDVMLMVREGRAAWGGGKPCGAGRPIKIRGEPISDRRRAGHLSPSQHRQIVNDLASAIAVAANAGEPLVSGSWDDALDAAAARVGLQLLRGRRR